MGGIHPCCSRTSRTPNQLPLLWRYQFPNPALVTTSSGYSSARPSPDSYAPLLPLSAFGTKNHPVDCTLDLCPVEPLSLTLHIYRPPSFSPIYSRGDLSSLFPIREYHCIIHCYTTPTIYCIIPFPCYFPSTHQWGFNLPRPGCLR